MHLPSPRGHGRKRITVREIPCDSCHSIFGQTAFEKSRNIKVCPVCASTLRASRPKNTRVIDDEARLHKRMGFEIVLPKLKKPHLDKRKHEWYLKVKVRKKGTNEKFTYDRIYLGVREGEEQDKLDTAFTAAYARLQGEGAHNKPAEVVKVKRERKWRRETNRKSWREGTKYRGVGISRQVIQRVVFALHLPDPLVDGKARYFGRFDTKAEARKARKDAYNGLVAEYVPCALCGKLPSNRRGMLTHVSSACPNVVKFPCGVRQLLQTKLWNLVFSKGGEHLGIGRISQKQLADMGYLFRFRFGKHYYVRNNVEMDFSLAAEYVTKMKKEKEPDEVLFE